MSCQVSNVVSDSRSWACEQVVHGSIRVEVMKLFSRCLLSHNSFTLDGAFLSAKIVQENVATVRLLQYSQLCDVDSIDPV